MRMSVSLGLLVVLSLCVAWIPFAASQPSTFPPHIRVEAESYYDAGYQVGNATKDRIRFRLENYTDIPQVRQFLATQVGRHIMDSLYNASMLYYPHLLEELRGIADGSGFRFFEDIFMLNVAEEVEYYANIGGAWVPPVGSDSIHTGVNFGKKRHDHHLDRCTDVMSNPPSMYGSPCWGHNEDGEIGDNSTTFISEVRIYQKDEKSGQRRLIESFVSYAYPGTIGGEAFAWNTHGLLFSENYLSPDVLNYHGVPAQFVNRAVLGLHTFTDVVAEVNRVPVAMGFSLNVGSLYEDAVQGCHMMMNIEVDSLNRVAVTHARPTVMVGDPAKAIPGSSNPSYSIFHTNVFLQLTMAGQNYTTDPDSWTRLYTLHNYSLPNSTADIRMMLGDTNHSSTYPLYGDGGGVWQSVTLATVIYDLKQRTARVYNSNPRLNKYIYEFDLTRE